MASYNSGFDPPSRQNPSRGRRLGAAMQQGLVKPPDRETDAIRITGSMESKRRTPVPTQTTLPRPSIKDPPTLRPRVEAQNTTSSTFGFGRSRSRPPLTPQLGGKTSRNVLRRKQSSIAQPAVPSGPPPQIPGPPSIFGSPYTLERRNPSVESSARSAHAYHDIFTRSDESPSTAANVPRPVIPELDRWGPRSEQPDDSSRMMTLPHKLSTQDLPPALPSSLITPVYSGGSNHHRYSGYSGSGYSASPSTRYSESPGPGGSYSRDTTPTSMSSQSPGIYLPSKITTPRLRQGSASTPNKPPVSSITRRRAGSTTEPDATTSPVVSSGLSVVRESLTSSSSNSTVKGDGKGKEKEREKKKTKRLSPCPPSPPPRKSSQKFKKPSPGEYDSPSKVSRSPSRPLMISPSPQLTSPSTKPRIAKPAVMPVGGPQSAKTSDANVQRPQAIALPPTRPSREGAQLPAQFVEHVNVIQSNLTNVNFSPEKRQSAVPSALQIQTSFRLQGSRIPSRNPSPAPIVPSREATPAPSELGLIPDLRPRQIPPSSRGTTPSPSSTTRSRFGLFSRRTKTEPAIETKERAPRKGPAAGTGHEGYGGYGLRGRSTSAGGQGRHERSYSIASSSQESIASMTATHDPFLLQRMSPVIIAGGGEVVENWNSGSELYRTESGSSMVLDGPNMNPGGSSKSKLGHEVSRTTIWPSAVPLESSKRTSAIAIPKGRRRPSDSSDDGHKQNTLALRRPVQRLGDSATALNLPKPLNVSSVGMSPSLTSLDASIMSDDSRLRSEVETRGRKAQLAKPRKLEKRQKSPTKWNFFQRSKPAVQVAAPAVAVTIGRAAPKAVPHYAMMDSSDDMDLEDLLREAALKDLSNEELEKTLSNEELDTLQFGRATENMRRNEDLHIHVPTPVATPAPMFSSPEPLATHELAQRELHLVKETAPVRPSRLQQVGRIPKVISARPETTSPKSFSRPFARLSVIHPQQVLVADKQSLALGRSPPKSSSPEPVVNSAVRHTSLESNSESTSSHHDFLAFSPRKDSEATTSSSGVISLLGTTAVIPAADAELAIDEVWDEYDDLIQDPVSATSSHGVPFQYESFESRRMRKSRQRPKESPTFSPAPKTTQAELERISHITSSSVYSQEMSTRLKEALATLPSPATTSSFAEADFIAGYGDRNNSFMSTASHSQPRLSHSSQSGSRKSNSSEGSRTISDILALEDQNPSPTSQVNLRVGSMTVSKWLTFGHVLFSPAKEEIIHVDQGPMKAHDILVIDGLGNDDWSFYAAETYRNATFYNLSPTAPPPSSQQTVGGISSPLNHRQIQHLSLAARFPFHDSFFSIIVLRFPAAMSEHGYKNLVTEAKRCLKPGGYLELAVLDLDMLNMGNRARRAVRGLKTRLCENDANVWTGSASDAVLRLLGKGWTDVKSCNVGVPVAGVVASASSSSTTTTEKGKGKAPSSSRTTTTKDRVRGNDKKQDLSLADLLKTDSPTSSADIANTVARVGRWWYTRCYENTSGENSIFQGEEGRRLLRECEKRSASFKLVVAYAQKPVLGPGIGSLGRGESGGKGRGGRKVSSV